MQYELSTNEWRDIPGYEGRYQASREGEIYSLISSRLLSQKIGNSGYMMVTVWNAKGEQRRRGVHRLVASAFYGIQPVGYAVHHKNDNKIDNRADNLEYMLRGKHASMHVTRTHQQGKMTNLHGKENPLKPSEVLNIRHSLKNGISARELAIRHNVDDSTIYRIKHGLIHKSVVEVP